MQRPRENRSFCGALAASCAALLLAATPLVAQQVTGATVPAEASAGVHVIALPGPAVPVALLLAAVQSAGGPTATVARPADASAPLSGPRVRPEIWGVEPRVADDRAALAAAAGGKNTIVISTLAIVLIAVIITILVVD